MSANADGDVLGRQDTVQVLSTTADAWRSLNPTASEVWIHAGLDIYEMAFFKQTLQIVCKAVHSMAIHGSKVSQPLTMAHLCGPDGSRCAQIVTPSPRCSQSFWASRRQTWAASPHRPYTHHHFLYVPWCEECYRTEQHEPSTGTSLSRHLDSTDQQC